MKPTTLFFDTEFTGLRADTSLLSIALLDTNGRSFYAELTDYNQEQLSFLQTEFNFNPLLRLEECNAPMANTKGENWQIKGDKSFVAKHLEAFCEAYDSIELWADCAAYDWVLFRLLFGDQFMLPIPIKNYFMPFDIYTLLKVKGIDYNISRKELVADKLETIPSGGDSHDALYDAWVTRLCWEKLTAL